MTFRKFEDRLVMDIKALKLELLKYILQSESQELLNKLLDTIKREGKDFYADLTEAQKKELEIARDQVKNGWVEDWEEVYLRISSKGVVAMTNQSHLSIND